MEVDLGISIEEERRNYVLFSMGQVPVLYERIGNTIHAGAGDSLRQVIDWLGSSTYTPRYISESLRSTRHSFSQLVLNVTDNCNLDCRYCIYSGLYLGERTNGTDNAPMSQVVAFRAVDIFAEGACESPTISFYGGEPSLAFGLIEDVVAYTKTKYPDRKFTYGITSNFVSMKPHLKFLIDNQFATLVSLDGPSFVHDKNRVDRGNNPTFRRVFRNLEWLKQMNPEYFKSCVGLSGVYASGEDFHDMVHFFLQDETFRYMRVILGPVERVLLRDSSLFVDDSPAVFSETMAWMVEQYMYNIIERRENPALLRIFFDTSLKRLYRRSRVYWPDELPLGGCFPGDQKLFVTSEGTFYTCEKIGQSRPIGNVYEGLNLDKVDALIEEYTSLRNKVCQECWAARECESCMVAASGPEGLSEDILRQNCPAYRSNLLLGIGIYFFLLQHDLRLNYQTYLADIKA